MNSAEGSSRKRTKSESSFHHKSEHSAEHQRGHHSKSDHHHETHRKGDHHHDSHHQGEHHHKGMDHHHHHHHKSDHHHKGLHHIGDYHSPSGSSHPIRPRAGTFSRRDAHPTHDQSDKHSTGTGEFPSTDLFEYENTYKLIPDCRFPESKVKNIILDVLKENIKERVYDASRSGSRCMLLSEIIKERVKTLHLHRFKIISMVMIGEESDQSLLMTSRCLWDQRFDNYASVSLKQGNVFALGLVFAVYRE